jgi:hypothetical protein
LQSNFRCGDTPVRAKLPFLIANSGIRLNIRGPHIKKANIVVARLARVARLLIAGISSVALTYAAVSSRAAQPAYDYNVSQIAPSIASTLSMTQIIAILNQEAPNPAYLDAYQQVTVTDATQAIASLAPLKVVQTDDSVHPYLGVFHNQATISKFATWAAYSADLIHWHTLGEIDDIANLEYGSQPDIRILSDDSVLFAEEYNPAKPDGSIPANKPHIRVRYYGNGAQTGLQAFIAQSTRNSYNPDRAAEYQCVFPSGRHAGIRPHRLQRLDPKLEDRDHSSLLQFWAAGHSGGRHPEQISIMVRPDRYDNQQPGNAGGRQRQDR